jgi:hypothetical protein
MARVLLDVHSDPLTTPRRRAEYSEGERQYSCVLQGRLFEVLQGNRDRLEVLRKFPNDPERLGVIAMPRDLPRNQLRIPVLEQLAYDALRLLRADELGGPVSQEIAPDGSIVEQQRFSTKYPHVLIERRDFYDGDELDPAVISWSVRRVQNQRRQVEINRVIDIAHLAIELIRSVR